jgi:hypothetical protein
VHGEKHSLNANEYYKHTVHAIYVEELQLLLVVGYVHVDLLNACSAVSAAFVLVLRPGNLFCWWIAFAVICPCCSKHVLKSMAP